MNPSARLYAIAYTNAVMVTARDHNQLVTFVKRSDSFDLQQGKNLLEGLNQTPPNSRAIKFIAARMYDEITEIKDRKTEAERNAA